MLSRIERRIGRTLFGDSAPVARPEAAVLHAVRQPETQLSTHPREGGYIAGGEATGGDPIERLVRRMPGRGTEHGLKLRLYHIIRESLPVLNASIGKRRFVEGLPVVESEDAGLQDAIREWMETVPVGYYENPALQTGLDIWSDALADSADEYGMGFGEIVLGEDGRYIERLVAPPPRSFSFDPVQVVRSGRQATLYRLMQRQSAGRVTVEGDMVHVLAFMPDTHGPWGKPLVWGCEFVAEVVLRMMFSLNNMWWRSGAPAELWQMVYNHEAQISTGEIKSDVQELESLIHQVYAARARGGTGDVTWGIKGGELKNTPIGASDTGLTEYFRDHYTSIAGQVISAADLPAWMFPAGTIAPEGLNSNRSIVEAGMAVTAAEKRNERKLPILRHAIDTFLLTEGSPRSIGKYDLFFEIPNLVEAKAEEETRAARETANAAAIDNALLLLDTGKIDEDGFHKYIAEAGVLENGGR